MATSAARQTPPGARPNREARGACRPHHVAHMRLPGRSLELRGDAHPRGMTVQDRTRLNGRLFTTACRGDSTGSRRPRVLVARCAGKKIQSTEQIWEITLRAGL